MEQYVSSALEEVTEDEQVLRVLPVHDVCRKNAFLWGPRLRNCLLNHLGESWEEKCLGAICSLRLHCLGMRSLILKASGNCPSRARGQCFSTAGRCDASGREELSCSQQTCHELLGHWPMMSLPRKPSGQV